MAASRRKPGRTPCSRKLPGKPIEWKKFFAMNISDRDLRLTVFEKKQAIMVRRGPVKDIEFSSCDYGPFISVTWKWQAKMSLLGRGAGQSWLLDSDTGYTFSVGNRPRLLTDGRIILYRKKDVLVDLLPEGDMLDPVEIRH